MKTLQLGNNGPQISVIGMGCMGMSEFYGISDDNLSTKIIQKGFELGINHFDTADGYGFGHNEILLGKAIKDFRNKIVVATKCGILRDKNNPSLRGICNKPSHIKKSCEQSLRRLNTDYIDLLYLHRIDQNIPIEESVGALQDLIQEGKIRYIGLSEANPKQIKRAHATHPLTAIQTEYSLWTQTPASEILPICSELGIGFIAYSPIGRGFLTGELTSLSQLSHDDFRRSLPRFREENLKENLKLVSHIKKIAMQKDCTITQIALAWILAQEGNIIPIPGMRQEKHLLDNIKASEIILDADELDLLNRLSVKYAPVGGRYSPAIMTTYGFKD